MAARPRVATSARRSAGAHRRARRRRAGPRGRRGAGHVGGRAAPRSAPGPHRARLVADGRRRALRRRLQGHEPARRRPRRWPRRPRAGGLDRGRPAQGRVGRRAGRRHVPRGCRRRWCSAPTGAAIVAALARHAPDVPVVEVAAGDDGPMHPAHRDAGRRRHDGGGPRPPPRWPGPATSSCSPRPRRRWTSSATTPHRGRRVRRRAVQARGVAVGAGR